VKRSLVVAFLITVALMVACVVASCTCGTETKPPPAPAPHAIKFGGASSSGSDIITCSQLVDSGAACSGYDAAGLLPLTPSTQDYDAGITRFVAMYGDSITQGSSASYAYPLIVQIVMGTAAKTFALGDPGKTCGQIATLHVLDGGLTPPFAAATTNYFSIMCGTNDRKDNADADPGDVLAAVSNMVAYAHDAGYQKTVVMIAPQWTGGNFPSNWTPYHAALLDAAATGTDYVFPLDGVDNGCLTRIQDAGDYTCIYMALSDKVHPNNNGQAAIGMAYGSWLSQH